jgi:hypothetical protein
MLFPELFAELTVPVERLPTQTILFIRMHIINITVVCFCNACNKQIRRVNIKILVVYYYYK